MDQSTTASITVAMPEDVPRVTSFFCPLVSRRYAFYTEIKLRAGDGILSQTKLKLKVPVQICQAPSDLVCFEDVDVESVEKPPVYVQ